MTHQLKTKLTPVQTPTDLRWDKTKLSLKEISKILAEEFKAKKKWTARCTESMKQTPKSLFLYDRFEKGLGNAYGADDKIALNPVMIQCYHPDCLSKGRKPIKLKNRLFDLDTYLLHLEEHVDPIGESMRKRFGAVKKNVFATAEELDELAPAPILLLKQSFDLNDNCHSKAKEALLRNLLAYGIERFPETNQTYICHWKDKLITDGIIDSSSLSFQEDDALIYNILQYPDPPSDWSVWQTVFLYSLKFISSISSAALNLYRGVTFNRANTKKEKLPGVRGFAKQINHACPSVNTTKRVFPSIRYKNDIYHPSEKLYHMKCLMKSSESFGFVFGENVVSIPVCLGIDEQETNQGTFLHNSHLYGLNKVMSVDEIKSIGLQNLGKHIAQNNNFNTAVREYRLTDLAGLFCSNIRTTFLCKEMNSDECTKALNEVVSNVKSCENCVRHHLCCEFDKIDQSCTNCMEGGIKCVRLIVFHVNWDMGSSHKKTALESAARLAEDSCRSDMLDSQKYTIGFGGLHLCKALVNALRNHEITYGGENFGINILTCLRYLSSLLLTLKNAVFIGKDRQSDFLSWLTVSPTVQQALLEQGSYHVQRLPERYVPYKATSQKKLIYPTNLVTNTNGDVFILDPGSSCILVVDRSIPATVVLIGKYKEPSIAPYQKNNNGKGNVARELLLSNSLTDMCIDQENSLFIFDKERGELVIVYTCSLAKQVPGRPFFILDINDILSFAVCDSLLVLRDGDSGQLIQSITYQIPKKTSTHNFQLECTVQRTWRISQDVVLRSLFGFNFTDCVGALNDSGTLCMVKLLPKVKTAAVSSMDLQSEVKPFSKDEKLLTFKDASINIYDIDDNGKTYFDRCYKISGALRGFCRNGKVTYSVTTDENNHCLMEHGSLDFAVKYANAVANLYDAIGYIPPKGDRKTRITNFEECIAKGIQCADLLQKMQEECEDRFVGRSTFMGPEGLPWSKTIQCVINTIKSWKVLLARVESITPGSSEQIYPPSVTSEHNVEHSFGFVGKKGQGHNQSQYEYITAKRNHAIDFQLRMCKMKFCQYQKSKIRDKGYQELEEGRVSLTVEDLREIFSFNEILNDAEDREEPANEISEEDEAIMNKAYLLSKNVPRQTNRAKHREKSGHAPNMLLDHVGPGKILKGDLLCTATIEDEILYLIAKRDVLLDNLDVQIPVTKVGDDLEFIVTYDKLLTEMGQIICIPPQLYETVEDKVIFKSNVMAMDHVSYKGRSDEEWAVLMDSESVEVREEEKGKKRKADVTEDERVVKLRKGEESEQNFVDEGSCSSKSNTDNDNTMASSSFHFNVNPGDESVTTSQYTPHSIEDLTLDKWVIVRLEHDSNWEYYIGQIINIFEDAAQVRCLEHAYGIGDPQDFEKERFWKRYSIRDIFVAPVIPKAALIGRAWKWKY